MNTRIAELYRQAFVPHTTICPDNNMPYETVLFSTEKFAELIVKECCNAADMYVGVTGAVGDCIGEYMGFGTEEGITEWRAK